MIIFMHEESGYLAWLSRHRRGYVVDWLRKPTRKQPILHRSSCPLVRRATGKHTHWTTGRHVKACSLQLEELTIWARAESGSEPAFCDQCQPQQTHRPPTSLSSHSVEEHVTPLAQSILDYVLDIAVLRLDGASKQYRVTIADVAQCLAKTPKQVQAPLLRLLEAGFLRTADGNADEMALDEQTRVYPTAKSLRRLPAFQRMPQTEIDTELQRLIVG